MTPFGAKLALSYSAVWCCLLFVFHKADPKTINRIGVVGTAGLIPVLLNMIWGWV